MDRRYQKSTGVIYEIPALQITIVRTGGLGSVKSVRYYVKHMRQRIKGLLLRTKLRNTGNSMPLRLSFFI